MAPTTTGPGFFDEVLVLGPEGLGVVHRAHRMRVPPPLTRAGAGHLVEAELGAGGDDQVVVGQRRHRRRASSLLPSASICVTALAMKPMPLRSSSGADLQDHVFALAPAHGDPGVGRHELEVVDRADHGDLVFLAQRGAHLVGGGHAAEAGAQDDDVSHALVSFRESVPARRAGWPCSRAGARRRPCSCRSRSTAAPC